MPRVDEPERLRRVAANIEASKPILADLAKAGFDVETISRLGHYAKQPDYKKAIPVLLHWLPLIENRDVKGAILHELAVKWARKTAAPVLLIQEFRKAASDYFLQWDIASALSVVADERVLDDILELVQNKAYGKAPAMLVVWLGKINSPRVISVLIELLDDPNLDVYAILALGKLKVKEARPLIERFVTHPKTYIRNEAKKALARIDKE